jgi:hypothetical protein
MVKPPDSMVVVREALETVAAALTGRADSSLIFPLNHLDRGDATPQATALAESRRKQ